MLRFGGQQFRSRLRGAIVVSLLAFAVGKAGWADETTLKNLGLKRRGPVWVLADELKIRELATKLSAGQREYADNEKVIFRMVEANRQSWRASRLQLAQINERLADIAKNDPRRKQLEAQRTAIVRAAVPPAKFAATQPIQRLLQQQCVGQCELLIGVDRIQKRVAMLESRYAELREDAALTAELAQAKSRLGPQRPLSALLAVANEVGGALSTDTIPMWLSGTDTRLSAIVNESAPISMVYDPQAAFFQISWSDADRLGLESPAEPDNRVLKDRGKTFTLKLATIGYLRFGSRVLRDCDVWVLPAEAEYLGTRIGPTAFGDSPPLVEPQRCQIRVSVR